MPTQNAQELQKIDVILELKWSLQNPCIIYKTMHSVFGLGSEI